MHKILDGLSPIGDVDHAAYAAFVAMNRTIQGLNTRDAAAALQIKGETVSMHASGEFAFAASASDSWPMPLEWIE